MTARRSALVALATVGILGLFAGQASAVHEATNLFDMAATAAAPDADATGHSTYVAGTEGWRNAIRASGLAPETAYEWRGIGGGRDVVICTLVTGGDGSGSCASRENSFLGRTELREASTGSVVALAVDRQDADQRVDDGEIERRGTCREAENPRCTQR